MIAIEQRVLIENYPKSVDERLLKKLLPEKRDGPSTSTLAGNGRNILLKYVKRTFNKEGNAEDQFKCEICGKIGSRKDNVLNHVENNHFPGTFDYKCKVCTKPMATKKSLENHMYRNHKEMSLV